MSETYQLKYKCKNCLFEANPAQFILSGNFWKKVSCPQCHKSNILLTLNGQEIPQLNKIPKIGLYFLTKSLQKKPNSTEFKI